MLDDDVDKLSVDQDTGEIHGVCCTATKVNGDACSVRAVRGTDPPLCIYHSPLYKVAGEAGRQLAGRKPVLKRLKEMPGDLRTPEDVLRAVNALANAIAERDMTPSNVGALVRLYALALDTMTGAQAELRLAELEALAAKGGDDA